LLYVEIALGFASFHIKPFVFGGIIIGGLIFGGGMQFSISSLVFAIFVFTGLIITGKLFYKRNPKKFT